MYIVLSVWPCEEEEGEEEEEEDAKEGWREGRSGRLVLLNVDTPVAGLLVPATPRRKDGKEEGGRRCIA